MAAKKDSLLQQRGATPCRLLRLSKAFPTLRRCLYRCRSV